LRFISDGGRTSVARISKYLWVRNGVRANGNGSWPNHMCADIVLVKIAADGNSSSVSQTPRAGFNKRALADCD
jgi:hypothetical protein